MDRATIHKLTSEKGRIVIGYEDYVYTLERKTNVKLIFRCQNRHYRGTLFSNISHKDNMITFFKIII